MGPEFVPAKLNRIQPSLGPEHMRSYTMSLPLSSHWSKVSCEEYECDDFLHGFALTIDVRTELGQRQHDYLTHDRSRTYSMQRVDLYTFKFLYPAGTPGFDGPKHDHYLPNGRDPFWLVQGGDWRGNPRQTPTRLHTRGEFWVEDFAGNQEAIAQIQKRG